MWNDRWVVLRKDDSGKGNAGVFFVSGVGSPGFVLAKGDENVMPHG